MSANDLEYDRRLPDWLPAEASQLVESRLARAMNRANRVAPNLIG
jgi:hypothetical protein